MRFLKDRRFIFGASMVVALLLIFILSRQNGKPAATIEVLSAKNASNNGTSIFDGGESNNTLTEGVEYYVEGVLSSDTVILRTGGNGTIFKLFGVESPAEAGFGTCYDNAAMTTLLGIIDGQPVTISFEPNGARLDDANNPIGYLTLPDDTLINEEIISQGYGLVAATAGGKYNDALNTAEQNARVAGRGMWKAKCSETTSATKNSPSETSSASNVTTNTADSASNGSAADLGQLPPPPPPPPPPSM
jgi:endonuclease YncB( thermonuclease family)